jgi:hypothetical protein
VDVVVDCVPRNHEAASRQRTKTLCSHRATECVRALEPSESAANEVSTPGGIRTLMSAKTQMGDIARLSRSRV